jgi:opacity protein-like surface antigen
MRNVLRAGACAAAILAGPFAASAADLAVVPPAARAPLWSWTGFYAGVHLASGWANPTWQSGDRFGGFVPFPGGASGNGAVGGGQIGWNYQTGPWVLGVEAAFSAADINAETLCAAAAFICTVNVDGLGTATGRLGFAFDQFLVYGKAAVAVEHSRDAMVVGGTTSAFSLNGSPTRWGWTTGAGVEFAFNPALSAFAEYDFLDFGTRGIAMVDSNGLGARIAVSERVQLVKVGLNYKLGQDPSSWTTTARALPVFSMPPTSSTWTGVYVGGHVGGGWGQTNWNSATGVFGNGTTLFAGSGPDNGFAIGGQLGFNYQLGPWVMGVEAEADWSDLDGNAPCAAFVLRGPVPPGPFATDFTCHTHINGLGALTGRLGQAFGNLLVYGKGGAAWDNESHFALNRFSAPNAFSANDTRRGWTVGAGLEYAFTPAWSGKIEYDYLSFANAPISFNDGAGNTSNVGLSQNISVVKMGFNYRLGADPTAGAYASAATPMWVKAPVFKAPPPSDWTIEAGARYWLSSRPQATRSRRQPSRCAVVAIDFRQRRRSGGGKLRTA